MRGVVQLVAHRFLPIITVTRTATTGRPRPLPGLPRVLLAIGYDRPRLKLLPTLRIGAEIDGSAAIMSEERVTPEMMAGFDARQ